MPFYTFKCCECGDKRDYLVKMGVKATACELCGGDAEYQLSMRTNATGLPNGFSATRSKSKEHRSDVEV